MRDELHPWGDSVTHQRSLIQAGRPLLARTRRPWRGRRDACGHKLTYKLPSNAETKKRVQNANLSPTKPS